MIVGHLPTCICNLVQVHLYVLYLQFCVIQASSFLFFGTPLANTSWIYFTLNCFVAASFDVYSATSMHTLFAIHVAGAIIATWIMYNAHGIYMKPCIYYVGLHQVFIRNWHLIEEIRYLSHL